MRKLISKARQFITRRYIFIISIAVLFLIWQVVYMLIDAWYQNADILISSPHAALVRFIESLGEYPFWRAVFSTVVRGLFALMLSIAIGTGLGLVMGFRKPMRQFFTPYIKLLQAIPPVSWIILAIIWLDNDIVPVFVMCVGLIPIMTINTTEGVLNIDPKIIEMANLYKLSKKTKLGIYIGSILPYIFSGISIIFGQAWKLAAVAEVLSNPRFGIGSELKWSLSNLQITDTIVWTVTIIIISAVFNSLLKLVRRRIERWKTAVHS
jgi:NitT/TauT family transport system permease protein